MRSRQPTRPIAFAHRGARAHAAENTIEAFQLARRLGATGLESDVWLTRDNVPVLDHDGLVGGRFRRRTIRSIDLADLPDHIPTVEAFYQDVGDQVEVSLDIKDVDAFGPTLALAAEVGAAHRLWACHHDWQTVAAWRDLSDDVRLVDSTRKAKLSEGPERRAASLAAAGIDAVNLHRSDWNKGLVTMFHRFGVAAFAWDAQQRREIDAMLDIGIDAIFSDHVDRMVEVFAHHGHGDPPVTLS